jgi:hypothetical protein
LVALVNTKVEQVLGLEREKMLFVAALHGERIKLYQTSLVNTKESERRFALDEVQKLKQKVTLRGDAKGPENEARMGTTCHGFGGHRHYQKSSPPHASLWRGW